MQLYYFELHTLRGEQFFRPDRTCFGHLDFGLDLASQLKILMLLIPHLVDRGNTLLVGKVEMVVRLVGVEAAGAAA